MNLIDRPALRYHGGKFRLAPWVMQFFPPHRIYTEAFGGAAGVLLQKPRAHGEVYNDLDGDVVNFFRVVRDPALREQLVDAVRLTPYARDEFDLAWQPAEDVVERARRLAIRAQMGFGSAGATKGTTGFRIDTKRRFTTAQHDWAAYPSAVAAAGLRFAGVLVENRPAVEVLCQHDAVDALHFVDPPYVHSTREMRSQSGYRHELDDDAHHDLLDCLEGLAGMVVLCGYSSDLYDERLQHWRRFTTDARISAGRGTVLRTEVLWINPACAAALDASDSGLFALAAA